ncbi:hypothetical protein [Paenibacillus sp. UNC451MF]|uniref:hypothetical protein n=1 Tax=Paenibacillus sp. UNC451MF TaxID=1449063 RepID=UPI0004902AAF|nr:hypothetical protein [Paenibacillus sp. UNC451MF]
MKPSDKEFELMVDYILIPIAITVVNTNRIEMETSAATLRKLYADTAMIMINRMREELSAVRKQMNERNMIVIDTEEQHDGDCARYPYILRDHMGHFTINQDVIRAGVVALINRYVAEVVHIVALNHTQIVPIRS